MTEDSAGSLFGGRYRLGSLLGVGGSAAVYEAEDLVDRDVTGHPAKVAVKVLHPHLCATDAERAAFLREAARAGQLRHPNIVSVRGSGVHDAGGIEQAWIALDLALGPTLAEWVEEVGPLSVEQAAEVMDGLLAGLGAAHDAGLVHRDVSPRNVILAVTDRVGRIDVAAGRVRLLDFGLADLSGRTTVGTDLLLADQGATGVGSVVGNAAYLSPEQATGLPVTPVSDLYSAGGVLHFLLTGRPPFPRSSVGLTIDAHLSAPPPVPSALAPAARALDRVVTTALAKDPGRRFPDAASFRTAIRDAMGQGVARHARPADAEYAPTRMLPLPTAGTTARPVPGRAAPAATPAPPGGATVGIAIAALVVVALLAVLSAFVVPSRLPALAPATPSPTAPTASATPTPTRTLPATVEVPAVHGTLAQAERALRSAGLTVGHLSRSNSAEKGGTVLGQSPDAGQQVARGSTVDLELASGSNEVPPVTGLTAAAAVAALQSAGFTVALDRPTAPSTTPVTDSMPSAGAVLRLGVTVTLVLDPGTVPSPSPSIPPSPSPTPSTP